MKTNQNAIEPQSDDENKSNCNHITDNENNRTPCSGRKVQSRPTHNINVWHLFWAEQTPKPHSS